MQGLIWLISAIFAYYYNYWLFVQLLFFRNLTGRIQGDAVTLQVAAGHSSASYFQEVLCDLVQYLSCRPKAGGGP